MSKEDKCNGLDCAICAATKCPNEKTIISDIDVSECKHHYTNLVNGIIYHGCAIYEQVNELGYTQDTLCEQNPNCYFKQLKRLQEENEELGKIINCKTGTIQSLAKVRDDLKQENKELKKRQITKNGFICDCEQNAKYKQTLEEIKNIAKCRIENLVILEKCNEVLNDRD